jgi:class 3 adenylate cyclase
MPRRLRERIDVQKRKFPPKTKTGKLTEERDIVILFADVVGCSEISNNNDLETYNNFISAFQKCFMTVCSHYQKEEYANNEDFFDYQSRGDEGCLKIFVPNRRDLSIDIDFAINIALDLKRKWLLETNNRTRIRNGLLPVDLGIGIHSGKVWLNKGKTGKDRRYRPEGYVINLAKRIENASRKGIFSRILISESARGELHLLKDECSYRFSKPFTIDPKGISRRIEVFEIMHHFLPTNWQEETNKPSEVSIVYGKLSDEDIEIVQKAYNCNPMNLWLAEEYILLDIMHSFHKKLYKKGKEMDIKATKEAYKQPLEIARRVANSNLRDAGTLALVGYILGECKEYKEEQQMYKEGIKLDEQDALLHWYLAYSMSSEIDDDRKAQKGKKLGDFYRNKANNDKIEKTLEEFKRAYELMPMNAWIVFDYACEQSRWSLVDRERFRKEAIDMLTEAFDKNSEVIKKAKREPYLKPIIDDHRVKPYLEKK